jgi:tetratricopeptide (TPR) repeat protein
MPEKMICCVSLPPATLESVPVYNFAIGKEDVANLDTKQYYSCCGKSICGGCIDSFFKSYNMEKCPFCNSERMGKTDEEEFEELMKRVEANDAGAMCQLGFYYRNGKIGLLQDEEKAMQLWTQAAALGSSQAHSKLGHVYYEGGDLKKAKFHYEAAAMAGHEAARNNLGTTEYNSGNVKRAVKHWTIAASAGHHSAMDNLLIAFNHGAISRDEIDLTLTAYNNSCAEMRSEARDAFINKCIDVGRRL